MAWNIHGRKAEHAGAKHGCGAFYGPKVIAKHASNTERRRNARRVVAAAVAESEPLRAARASEELLPTGGRPARRDTRRWCSGKIGRHHAFVLQETLGAQFGLPPLHVWRCTRCGRKAHNLQHRALEGTVAKAPSAAKEIE